MALNSSTYVTSFICKREQYGSSSVETRTTRANGPNPEYDYLKYDCCGSIYFELSVIYYSINLFGSWILAMPVAGCLAFKTSLGIYGLWWGMSVGVLFSAFACQFVLNWRIDWDSECSKAEQRLSFMSLSDSNRRASSEPLLQAGGTTSEQSDIA